MFAFVAAFISPLIVGLLVLHLFVFGWLYLARQSQLRALRRFLVSIVQPLSKRSDPPPSGDVDDEIERFIADLRDELAVTDAGDAHPLAARLDHKDEARPYLAAKHVEFWHNLARTTVEVYPLLGIMGTLLAIVAVQGDAGAAASAGEVDAGTYAGRLVGAFGAALWSTVWGLLAAMITMLVNAALEPGMERLVEHRASVRDLIRSARNLLRAGGGTEP